MLFEIDFLVFHTAPQPLDEDIVHLATSTVHADRNAKLSKARGPFI